MIEYGVRDPNVMVGGTIGEKPLTYVTDVRRTIATSGIWFPFRPVVTTTKEWRKLRGWDRTHEYDAAYELVETIFAGHSARRPGVEDKLENGVYSFQYHPELARDPSVNNGKGTLDYVRYCINLAERSNYWIATQAELYQRMADYEGLAFDVRDGGREVTIANPTDRRIAAMVLEQRLPFGSVWLGEEELIHVADGAFVTIPPIDPGASLTLRFEPGTVEAVLVRQPSNKGLVVLDARHDPRSGEARITVSVCRQQPLSIEGVDPEGRLSRADRQPAAAGRRGAHRADHPGVAQRKDRRRPGPQPARRHAGHHALPRPCRRGRGEPVRRAHAPHPAIAGRGGPADPAGPHRCHSRQARPRDLRMAAVGR